VTCAPGLGRCIDDLCADVDCPGPCDPLRGCVERDCSTDADCRLIYSPCGCQAIPPGDPRTSLDPCDYDGGAVCDTNNCLVDGVLARCDGGLCVEAYPPGCGG
jgi:hypothetical protein